MPDSRRILFILPLSAIVIAGLCAYKLSRPSERPEPTNPVVFVKRAPLFELYDDSKPPQVVRLVRYIGRHRIVLAFFDPTSLLYFDPTFQLFFDPTFGIADDPVLGRLLEHANEMRRDGTKILLISPLLPQDHRKMLDEIFEEGEPKPIEMFSDFKNDAQRLYGLPEPKSARVSTKVFLIDRAGNLTWNQDRPMPLDDPVRDLKTEFGIE